MASFPRWLERSVRHRFGRRARRRVSGEPCACARELETLTLLAAGAEARRVRALPAGAPLAEAEFRVYSQFGEDGILQFLVSHVAMGELRFVEFGVEDFREANCRLLMTLDPWSGLVLDGDPLLGAKLESHPSSFLRKLEHRSRFITRENIDAVLTEAGYTGDLGVLSIDVDGNDYWIWEAITAVSARIVVVEYQSLFGRESTVAVPYAPDFHRRRAHYSWLYSGASLGAFEHLAARKGYSLVGSNRAGNNAFFVRDDVLGELPATTAREAWVESTFRESRDPEGRPTRLSGWDRLAPIGDLPLVDVRTGRACVVRDLQPGR